MIHNIRFRWLMIALLGVASCTACQEPIEPDDTPHHASLIYLVADNSLDSYIRPNVDSILSGFSKLSEEELWIYLDRKGSATPTLTRYKVNRKHEIDTILVRTYEEQNSIKKEVMSAIIEEVMDKTECSVGIVFWSHAMNWLPAEKDGNPDKEDAIIQPSSFGDDGGYNMEVADLKTVLRSLPEKLDYIMFDACFMASAEVAYELHECADYLLASGTEIMGNGFPYQDMMLPIYSGDLSAAAKAYLDFYSTRKSYPSGSISLIRLSEMEGLAAATKIIMTAHSTEWDTISVSSVQPMETMTIHKIFDLEDFLSKCATPEEMLTWRTAFDKAVVTAGATPQIFSIFNSPYWFEMNRYCGLTTYIMGAAEPVLDNAYRDLMWYNASGWAEVDQ